MSVLSEYFKSREDPHKVFFDSLDFPSFLSSFSALDRFYGYSCGSFLNIATGASLVEVARCFDDLEFPGLPGIDAIVNISRDELYIDSRTARDRLLPEGDNGTITLLVSCQLDDGSLAVPLVESEGSLQKFLYSPSARRFYDPAGIYKILRGKKPVDIQSTGLDCPVSWEPWLDAAVIISRYPGLDWSGSSAGRFDKDPEGPADESGSEAGGTSEPFSAADLCDGSFFPEVDFFRQREVLTRILEGKNPAGGLEFLRRCGFIESHWPELHRMIRVRQGKEYHPEGDVWDHSLATFSYRKNTDPVISLSLLLHDSGKPEAAEFEGNKFHRHAQLGGRVASRFLRRLDFPEELIETVVFLVTNHMVPGITRTLPAFRVKDVISSPLYPLLLEVHRCDLSSTFRGPDGYYEACKVYRRYLKNVRNPFRGTDGKKKLRLYVEG